MTHSQKNVHKMVSLEKVAPLNFSSNPKVARTSSSAQLFVHIFNEYRIILQRNLREKIKILWVEDCLSKEGREGVP